MLQAKTIYHPLNFRKPAGTSRGVLHHKESWFLIIFDSEAPQKVGIGECSLIPGLSIDNRDVLEQELAALCADISAYSQWVSEKGRQFPAIRFALETALADLENGGNRIFGETYFTQGQAGIPINGLIWMGTARDMQQQIREKLDAGFNCIKIKIGAIDLETELELLRGIRDEFGPDTIEIRVDANGAFTPQQAPDVLALLAALHIHSIEQPIRQGQWEAMADLCQNTPIPVALDEELIGVYGETQRHLLEAIRPQFIILKPGLLGGLAAAAHWIGLANEMNIGWWVTSALESNIGLNAIAQWTWKLKTTMPQGLGTGQLFTNNLNSPLVIEKGRLLFRKARPWNLKPLGL
jgi:o-succinylbenzoate synthase